ncbi:hypothetical protein [Butyrivibrio sp. ob235]|uniref:hypothetical protein n=1 Tax=Butyrivibrio sp. ob235 TaxID=1761780 RepID=UPI00111350B0|nr:hypothetical protein [Butyrivibrio sp. ob235]
MEIKQVTENERTSEFINVEFTNYATDCDVALNFEEFCFAAVDDGNTILNEKEYNRRAKKASLVLL